MNLKLNNDVRSTSKLPSKTNRLSQVKEERQRTGRYIAILVGISLFLLAIYHAWVRRIPVVASLVVPALIMFIYVGWVLYTASRDKHRLLDAEAALAAAALNASALNLDNEPHTLDANSPSIEQTCKHVTRDTYIAEDKQYPEITSVIMKEQRRNCDRSIARVKPIILINGEPPDDIDILWSNVISGEGVVGCRLKGAPVRRKFKRRFCRSKRNAAFKRSYSIG